MINFDDVTCENRKERNPNWLHFPDYPHRILIIGGSGSRKINAILNLINLQPDTDKFIYTLKIHMKQKYQLLINKRQSVGLRHCFDLKAFIKYFNDMRDIYEDIDKYN